MKTTLLGLAMPKVLESLKEILIHKGFLVQIMPTSNPVLIAHQKGSWYRRPRQLVLELSTVDNNTTRIDITAIIEKKKFSSRVEEIYEMTIASVLFNTFKNVIHTPNGIR